MINRVPGLVVPPRTYIAGLFDIVGVEQPLEALVPAPDWLGVGISLTTGLSGMNADDVSLRHLSQQDQAIPTAWRASS